MTVIASPSSSKAKAKEITRTGGGGGGGVSIQVWLKRSASSAFRGGISGSIAMVLQVILLMWLRTVVNYQYRHGVSSFEAFRILYKEGGILRFYRGASFALLTGPVSRFGDTAANEGIKDLMTGSNLPVWAITLMASLTAAFWRVAITPLDTIKTTLQVSGSTGWDRLFLKVQSHGIKTLWDGALGNYLATLAGHYPWCKYNQYFCGVIILNNKNNNNRKLHYCASLSHLISIHLIVFLLFFQIFSQQLL